MPVSNEATITGFVTTVVKTFAIGFQSRHGESFQTPTARSLLREGLINNKIMRGIGLENFSYWYPKTEQAALSDINLEIAEGDFVAILGPRASGKTTLCLAVTGMLHRLFGGRLMGSVKIQDDDAHAGSLDKTAATIGMVFQNPETMFCNLRVKEEVAFGLENLSVAPELMSGLVDDALEEVGLAGFQERYIYELSGGELQRLAIACALVTNPPILILDEPTSSIDPAGTETLFAILRELRAKGKTVIVTYKEWNESVTEADTVVVLANGSLICKGFPYEVANIIGEQSNETGFFLPEVTEVALSLKRRGVHIPALPLTIKEASDLLRDKKLIYVSQNGNSPTAVSQTGPSLELRDIFFVYPNGHAAVRDIGIDVPTGTICALVGNNGAGKTTLAKIMVGLLRPKHGEIFILGERAKARYRHSVYPHVTYVFQNPTHQFLADSVYNEVALGLQIRGLSGEAVAARVDEVLEKFGLSEIKAAHPLTISAAQQRLVTIASAFALDPKILILDEPTHGQDRFTAENLQSLFAGFKKEGSTLVVITHDMRFVEACVDIAYVMSQGSLIFKGSPSDLFNNSEVMQQAALKPTQLAQLVKSVARANPDNLLYPRTPAEFAASIFDAQNPHNSG
jgi:energy-coupling factor transport system ATP-binding protein